METLTYINLNVHENPEKQFQLWPLLKNRKIQWLNTFANVKQGIHKNLHKSFPPIFFWHIMYSKILPKFTRTYRKVSSKLLHFVQEMASECQDLDMLCIRYSSYFVVLKIN